LPLLQSGRSFKFAIVEGGKDPDEVLREQGPAALKQQLSQTTAFVDALFIRERDLEPIDTPERRSGFKGRLRQAASVIADKDLQQAYREALLDRYDGLFTQRAAQAGEGRPWSGQRPGQRQGRRGGGPDPWASAAPTAAGKAAAKRLAQSLEAMPAALARFVVEDPAVLDDHMEDAFTAGGFGEPGLAKLTKEITRLRLESEHLDSGPLARHLASCGFSVLLTDIDRAAASSGAPFLREDVSLDARRSQWSRLFVALARAAALDDAIDAAKGNLRGRSDMAAFERLKTERDALKRAIRTGTIWAEGGS
jgi:DNA primase